MHIQQKKFSSAAGWQTLRDDGADQSSYNLVIVFGSTSLLSEGELYEQIRRDYPCATVLFNSTAGEIIDTEVNDDSLSVSALQLRHTGLRTAMVDMQTVADSFEAGQQLGAQLESDGLKYVLVIADGQQVNGSDLVTSLQQSLPDNVIITGGLAGDGARFAQTLVGLNCLPASGKVAAVGFYGDHISITYGSVGGWDSFGHERLITRSKKNILYELDNAPALDIYKKYLGDYAAELPLSGLLFPLSIRTANYNHSLVRTILSVDEKEKSLTFAGNMPEGSYARFMKANFDRLIEGSSMAARNSISADKIQPDLALLISCVGRKIVLDQRVEEEVEVVRAMYGNRTAITGFYSYGEISPSLHFQQCELHNQTMTITTFTEAA
jgi:hypothetical protein